MSDPQKYTVGWICAVTAEFVAARAFFDEKHDQLDAIADDDNNNYALGKIGKHNIVMAVLPKSEYGTSSAAVVANNMLRSFPNIRFGLMVGIGGGAPNAKHDIRLGDVVVSTRSNGKGGVFQYDYGKTIQGHAFVTTGFLNQPPQLLLAAISGLEAEYELEGHHLGTHVDKALEQWPRLRKKYSRPPLDSDRLYRSDVVHPDSTDGCDDTCGNDSARLIIRTDRDEEEDNPAIHYGLIASANQLMKNALVRDELAASKNVLCFEMEAAGLMNHFPCVVIRGICDYSDSHKNKDWQGFAAMMAAAYAKDLLRQIPTSKVEAEIPIREILSSIETTGHETKKVVMGMASEQHLAKIKRWISPSDYSSNVNLARKQRHPGTGTWLLDSTSFQEWKLGSRQHLWLYGMAGCGKTILSTTILDHILSLGTHNTLAFFFDFNDPKKQKLDDLLLALAFQLYHIQEGNTRRLDDLFTSHDNGRRQPDTTAVSTYVDSSIRTTENLVIVLDALDECTMKRELVHWIEGLVSSKVQFIVTGRPEADFQSTIPQLFGNVNCIMLDKAAVDADIRSYVTATLEQKRVFLEKNLSQNLLGEIRKKVGDRADGMFRWAACQLETLALCLSPKDIKTALNSLPSDLDETYRRMLDSIPPDLKPTAIRLLQFLLYTPQPLTVTEAVEIIATQIDKEPRGFDVDGRLCQQHDVLRYCPSLLSIVEVKKDVKIIEELHLAHFSVKEYLLKQCQFDLLSACIVRTITCLTYLYDIKLNHTVGKSHREISRDFPMLLYAARYWMKFAVLAEKSENIARIIVIFLRDDMVLERWTRSIGGLYRQAALPSSPEELRIYISCLGGLTKTVQYLIEEDDANRRSLSCHRSRYDYGLRAASRQGNLRVMRLLLDRGANPNAIRDVISDHIGSTTPLIAASRNGHLEAVQLLLDSGANPNIQSCLSRNALHGAASEAHPDVVQLLLDHGADVNAKALRWSPALNSAVFRQDNSRVVRLLLDHGADPSIKDRIWGTALQGAICWKDNLENIRLLLDYGAVANAQTFLDTTFHASAEVDPEATHLLLDYGLDIDAQALQSAPWLDFQLRHPRAMRVLLERAADVNAQGGHEGNSSGTEFHDGN